MTETTKVSELQPASAAAAMPRAKTDEQALEEIEGKETAAAYLRTLEELIYAGSITEACERSGMAERTFHRVKNRSAPAWQLYARARASRADYRFDNLVKRVEEIPDPNKARVVLDAEKWTISKMNRGLYDDTPPAQAGSVNVTINNDGGAKALLEEIRQRLERKRKSMLTVGGEGVAGEKEAPHGSDQPLTLPSRT